MLHAVIYTPALFFHFDDYFPSGPALASTRTCLLWTLLKLRMMEVVVTAGANRCTKLQSNDHHQQTNTSYLPGGPTKVKPTYIFVCKFE